MTGTDTPKLPTFTKIWHSKPYDAVSLNRPELSMRGKVVIVTSGGSGICASIATSFAKAGAAAIGLIGRREGSLAEIQKNIQSRVNNANVKYATANVSNATETQAAFEKLRDSLGAINILVSNAGYLTIPSLITSAVAEDWWESFEINVKGRFNAARSFLSIAGTDPVLLNISTGTAHLPAMPTFSSYAASNIATAKMVENLAVEHPELHVVNVQPGIIETGLNRKSGMPSFDDIELPGNLSVWLASPEARFLKGKFV